MATAVRYGLPTAQLLNAAGKFVAPNTASLLAGEAAMKSSTVPGVLESNSGATDPAAYPLTALSYAVTAPSALDTAAGKDYAAFIRYAAGPGQQPGVQPVSSRRAWRRCPPRSKPRHRRRGNHRGAGGQDLRWPTSAAAHPSRRRSRWRYQLDRRHQRGTRLGWNHDQHGRRI